MANGTTLPWAVSPFSWFRCPRAGLPGLAGTSNDGLVVAVCRGNLPSQIVVMEPCAPAVALAAWFVAFLIIWMASPDRWLTDHLFGWLPWQLRQLSSVAGGGLAGMEFVALMILAFVGNGFAGPVTEKLYFRGHLLSGSLRATGMDSADHRCQHVRPLSRVDAMVVAPDHGGIPAHRMAGPPSAECVPGRGCTRADQQCLPLADNRRVPFGVTRPDAMRPDSSSQAR